jgi:hypothetical protein
MEHAARKTRDALTPMCARGRGQGVTDRPVKSTGSPGSNRSWGSLESVRNVVQDGDQNRLVPDIRGEKHGEVERLRRDGNRQAAGCAEAAGVGSLIAGRRTIVPVVRQ